MTAKSNSEKSVTNAVTMQLILENTIIKIKPYVIPAILAIAYGSFVSSNFPVNKYSSLIG